MASLRIRRDFVKGCDPRFRPPLRMSSERVAESRFCQVPTERSYPLENGPGTQSALLRCFQLVQLLLAYRPDYFVSGHDHAFPYKSGQSWNQRMGKVCVLVPGQLMSAPFPNHINLDSESGENPGKPFDRYGCRRTSALIIGDRRKI
jgi:hypothetical protein